MIGLIIKFGGIVSESLIVKISLILGDSCANECFCRDPFHEPYDKHGENC